MATEIHSHTLALCPQCYGKVQARITERDGRIYLEKFCPDHGFSETMISSDAQWYRESISYVKPKELPLKRNVDYWKGCPESCGFCPEHQQHTCLPVIEITSACNLSCPICLKQFSQPFELTVDEFAAILDNLFQCERAINVINLSGGEPFLHPELAELLRLAADKGVTQVTISTNGLLLLDNKELRMRIRESGAIVALQFDGFDRNAYGLLRGNDLLEDKREIIRLMEEEGIKYSLVSTIASGINDREIKGITDFFFSSKAISLMFQPITFTGRAVDFQGGERITIPDVVREIEKSGFVKKGDFNPLPCSHYSCFALAYYFILGEDRFLGLKEFLGQDEYLNVIANKTLPGLDSQGFSSIRNRLYELWSLSDSGSTDEQILARIRTVLKNMEGRDLPSKERLSLGIRSMKAIFIHDFMDVNTFDFGRLIKCCNPYPQKDGRLVPMCAQNVLFQEDKNIIGGLHDLE